MTTPLRISKPADVQLNAYPSNYRSLLTEDTSSAFGSVMLIQEIFYKMSPHISGPAGGICQSVLVKKLKNLGLLKWGDHENFLKYSRLYCKGNGINLSFLEEKACSKLDGSEIAEFKEGMDPALYAAVEEGISAEKEKIEGKKCKTGKCNIGEEIHQKAVATNKEDGNKIKGHYFWKEKDPKNPVYWQGSFEFVVPYEPNPVWRSLAGSLVEYVRTQHNEIISLNDASIYLDGAYAGLQVMVNNIEADIMVTHNDAIALFKQEMANGTLDIGDPDKLKGLALKAGESIEWHYRDKAQEPNSDYVFEDEIVISTRNRPVIAEQATD